MYMYIYICRSIVSVSDFPHTHIYAYMLSPQSRVPSSGAADDAGGLSLPRLTLKEVPGVSPALSLKRSRSTYSGLQTVGILT